MIATRQKIDATNRAVQDLLQSGRYPTLDAILKGIAKRAGRGWGRPKAELRPAIDGQKIGGDDGTAITQTYSEIRDDLGTWLAEIVETADRSLSNFWLFESRADTLRREALHLIQSAESSITGFALGGAAVFRDTFNTLAQTDMNETTAEIDLAGGYVTIPASIDSLDPESLTGSEIIKESYPNAKVRGNLKDAFADATNTGWFASLDGGSYSCTVKPQSPITANGLILHPTGPMRVKITYSNDLHNFYPFSEPIDCEVLRDRTFTFNEVNVAALRLEISGTDVGLRSIKLLSCGFEEQSVLYSTPHVSRDIFGNVVPIESVSIETEADIPPLTDITYFIKPLYADGSSGVWTRVNKDNLWLTNYDEFRIAVSSPNGIQPFVPEAVQDGDTPRFYVYRANTNPITETSRLTKGGDPNDGGNCGQLLVEYAVYDWAKEAAEPEHSPSPADWYSFGVAAKGYMRPVTQISQASSMIGSVSDPLQAASNVMGNFGTMLCEATMSSSTTDPARDWLVLGCVHGSTNTKYGNQMLAPNGNYRMTTWVYMPEDKVVADRPCMVYNPVDKGGLGSPTVLTARVYLNDNLVADVRDSWSGDIVSWDYSSYNVTYSYKAGWNKFEIYLYYTGRTAKPDASGETYNSKLPSGHSISDAGIGLYIAGNPYELARQDPKVKIQAHPEDLKQVSEFAVRHLLRPGDRSSWAWTDTAPQRNVILNYNPMDGINTVDDDGAPSPVYFDSKNRFEPPVLALTYYKPITARPTGLKFKAELSREPSAGAIPKLHGYKLIVNRLGV
jgi:hypothetical protein